MAAAGRKKLSASELLTQSADFASWMLDEFICCNLGDSGQAVINTALGENPEFPVRTTIAIQIRRDDIIQELFPISVGPQTANPAASERPERFHEV